MTAPAKPAGRPEPVGYSVQDAAGHISLFTSEYEAHSYAEWANGGGRHVKPIYGPDLLAYADRVAAERDEAIRAVDKIHQVGLLHLNRAETAERQLAELQAKHDALVRAAETIRPLSALDNAEDAERWKKGSEIGFPKVHAPEHTGSLLTYWTNGNGLKYASAELAIDAARKESHD